jgi:hypothetical protein
MPRIVTAGMKNLIGIALMDRGHVARFGSRRSGRSHHCGDL